MKLERRDLGRRNPEPPNQVGLERASQCGRGEPPEVALLAASRDRIGRKPRVDLLVEPRHLSRGVARGVRPDDDRVEVAQPCAPELETRADRLDRELMRRMSHTSQALFLHIGHDAALIDKCRCGVDAMEIAEVTHSDSDDPIERPLALYSAIRARCTPAVMMDQRIMIMNS